jgi:hypothetical protein
MEELLNKARTNKTHADLEVLAVLLMKIQDLWYVTLC